MKHTIQNRREKFTRIRGSRKTNTQTKKNTKPHNTIHPTIPISIAKLLSSPKTQKFTFYKMN